VLLHVDPDGPACHTSERTCFFTEVTTDSDAALVNTKVDS
jgi:hypothetical protein